MRNGEKPPVKRRGGNRCQEGFTYIALLLAVAILGIGLGATGQVWSLSSQREKERDLLFAGHQMRDAIKSYALATPGPVPRYPVKFEDLLQDNRYPGIKRHLRRVYRDPMSANGEWGLIQAPGGGIQGVYSLSSAKPVKTTGFDYDDRSFEGAPSYSEWRFSYEPAPVAAPAPGIK